MTLGLISEGTKNNGIADLTARKTPLHYAFLSNTIQKWCSASAANIYAT